MSQYKIRIQRKKDDHKVARIALQKNFPQAIPTKSVELFLEASIETLKDQLETDAVHLLTHTVDNSSFSAVLAVQLHIDIVDSLTQTLCKTAIQSFSSAEQLLFEPETSPVEDTSSSQKSTKALSKQELLLLHAVSDSTAAGVVSIEQQEQTHYQALTEAMKQLSDKQEQLSLTIESGLTSGTQQQETVTQLKTALDELTDQQAALRELVKSTITANQTNEQASTSHLNEAISQLTTQHQLLHTALDTSLTKESDTAQQLKQYVKEVTSEQLQLQAMLITAFKESQTAQASAYGDLLELLKNMSQKQNLLYDSMLSSIENNQRLKVPETRKQLQESEVLISTPNHFSNSLVTTQLLSVRDELIELEKAYDFTSTEKGATYIAKEELKTLKRKIAYCEHQWNCVKNLPFYVEHEFPDFDPKMTHWAETNAYLSSVVKKKLFKRSNIKVPSSQWVKISFFGDFCDKLSFMIQ